MPGALIETSPRLPPAWRAVLAAAAIAVAVTLPFVLKGFMVFQLTMVLIYAIAILGLNLLTGINGQFSLGHGAFFALGAYVAGILLEHAGWAWPATLPASGLAAFAAGVLIGLPALRLAPIYLALATFALAVATPQILKLTPLEGLTGGVQGLLVPKPEPPRGLPLTQDQWLYLITLAVALALYWIARNIVSSRTGRALMAIRDNPTAALAMGIDVARIKTLTFGVSAMFTGIAGALSAFVVGFVAPDSFTFSLSVALLVGLVVGGVGWLPGALLGGAFVLFVPNFAEHVHKGLSGAIYGLCLILVVYLMPSGAGGFLRALVSKLPRRRLP